MKKFRVIAAVCAVFILTAVFGGCASESGGKDKLNAYTAAYDEVAGMLKSSGAIQDTEKYKDINTEKGYWFDNSTNEKSAEAIFTADTARDYDGIYLIWFDINGENVSAWADMKINDATLVYEGGMAVLKLDTYKGMFGLGFGDGVSEDIKTKAAEAFDKLEASAPENAKYMTGADELAIRLKDKGYLSAADLASENLNTQYYVEGPGSEWDEEKGDYVDVDNYKYYAEFGSEAKKYGKISIFYFNTLDKFAFSDENIDSYGAGLAYKSVLANNAVTGYAADIEWKYTPYTENGSEVSFPVDAVFGRFAVAVDDSVENKAEIVEYLKGLAE